MFRDDFKAYYGDIRGISNEISRENDLSVIEPKGKGKPYAEWNAEKNGKPTVRGLIRQDIDTALADAFTLQSFFEALQKRGYADAHGGQAAWIGSLCPAGQPGQRLYRSGYTGTAESEPHGADSAGNTGHAFLVCPERPV